MAPVSRKNKGDSDGVDIERALYAEYVTYASSGMDSEVEATAAVFGAGLLDWE